MRRRMTAGERFGRLITVREDVRSKSGKARWLCACDCGAEKTIGTSALRSGDTSSCGCLMKERLRELRTKHGAKGTPEYQTWLGMKKRCGTPSGRSFPHYGGRGIKVCARWASDFDAFLADMGIRPSSRHSIERVNVDGDYEPANCVWATPDQQQNNRRNNQLIEFKGQVLTIAQAAKIAAVSQATLRARILKLGWDPVEAMTLPASPTPQRRASSALAKPLPARRLSSNTESRT